MSSTVKLLAKTLKHFIDNNCESDHQCRVHILPFFPYSSDDGFSVIDYSSVNESLGDWMTLRDIAEDYRLMADVGHQPLLIAKRLV